MTWGAYDSDIKYHFMYLLLITINKIKFIKNTMSIFAVVDISDFGWIRSHTMVTLFCNTDSYPTCDMMIDIMRENLEPKIKFP